MDQVQSRRFDVIEITVQRYANESQWSEMPVWIFTSHGPQRVTGLRRFSDGPWVVCGEENGGFGVSYCVTWDSRLYVGLRESVVLEWRRERAREAARMAAVGRRS